MKTFLVLALITAFMTNLYAQEEDKTLIADGTADAPVKRDLQPMVEKLSAANSSRPRGGARGGSRV
jgi:hypothetical protein